MKRILAAVLLVVGMMVVVPSYAGEVSYGLFKVERQPAYKISMTCDKFESLIDELGLSVEAEDNKDVVVRSRIYEEDISLTLYDCILVSAEKKSFRYSFSPPFVLEYRLIFSESNYRTIDGYRFWITIRLGPAVSYEVQEMFFKRETPFNLTGRVVLPLDGGRQQFSKESDLEFIISIYPETVDGKPVTK